MSVTIRLAKIGKKNAHAFRVVAAETKSKRNGKFLDILGFFNPSDKKSKPELNKAKIEEWVKKGAIVTKAVSDLLDGKYVFKPYSPKKQNAATAKAETEETPAI